MYIAILGRQPALGIAELEMLYGPGPVRWFSDVSAIVQSPDFDFERLGGTQKAGRVVAEVRGDWLQVSRKLVSAYTQAWQDRSGKITVGISAYGFKASARDIQKTGIILKSKLKESGVSLRLVPNAEPALNTATSHHNKLGLADNKVEIIVVRASGGAVIIAESVGSQNITALAERDQGRPKRDAFVGMLPPKLARMMVNLTGVTASRAPAPDTGEKRHHANAHNPTLLDPFCGTGVVLQEAALMGFNVVGTDLAPKMVEYSAANMQWLRDKYHLVNDITVYEGDAMTTKWAESIDAVACESYLGQPFSAPPSPTKLTEVRGNCNHIISEFLRNISDQLEPGTPLCVAVPAWRSAEGTFTHLPLVDQLGEFGLSRHELKNARASQLLYYREDQVVARELLLLVKN